MIAIVTDSTAYLTPEDARYLHAHVVPHTYTTGIQTYAEGFSGENGGFTQLLQENICVTAQCSISSFHAAFTGLLQRGYDILCVVLSSRLSGAYSSAKAASLALCSHRRYAGRIQVVDSRTTAGALRFLLGKARALADQGLPLNKLARACESLRDKVGLAFSVDTMDRLRKSGRLGIVRQSVSTILNRRPILLLENGAVFSQDTAIGKSGQASRLAEKISAGAKSVTLHYFGNPQNLQPLVAAIRRRFFNIPMTFRELGPVLGIHIGTGTIGVSWEED